MKTPAELKNWLKNRNAMSDYSSGTLEYIDKLEGVVSDFILKTAMLEKERDALLADLKEADMLE